MRNFISIVLYLNVRLHDKINTFMDGVFPHIA